MDVQGIGPTSSLVERYRIERPLRRTNLYDAFEAHDLILGRTVALRIFKPGPSSDPFLREQVFNEGKLASELEHPNVISLYDYGFQDNLLFWVTEYVAGYSLGEFLQRKPTPSLDSILWLMKQACAGVGYAHQRGLVHTGLSPECLFVSDQGVLKVDEFGLARALTAWRNENRESSERRHNPYFSPEQVSGLALSPASDVYSLGKILQKMIDAVVAPASQSSGNAGTGILTPMVPFADPSEKELLSELEVLISKCLAPEPIARYRNASQLGYVLDSLSKKRAESRSRSASADGLASGPSAGDTKGTDDGTKTGGHKTLSENQDDAAEEHIDWQTVVLGLLALVAVGGLIPFWLYIWLSLRVLIP